MKHKEDVLRSGPSGNVMRISLLRCATGPDPHQDQGRHEFSFALLPHREHFYETKVPQLAAIFNAPLRVQYASPSAIQSLTSEVFGPFKIEGAPNVILDTTKRAEDDDFMSTNASKTVICRLYESKGGHAKATLASTLPIRKATIVDLLERKLEDIELVDLESWYGKHSIQLSFRGFQIITVKLELGSDSSNVWTGISKDEAYPPFRLD